MPTRLKEVTLEVVLNQELKIDGHKTVHAGYASGIYIGFI